MLKTIVRALDPTADAISLLKEDHRKVEDLFSQYEAASDKRRKSSIAQQTCIELALHAKIEESVFYPAAQREVPTAHDEVNEARVEHAGIKRLVAELQGMSGSDEMFDAKMTVLMEYVKHHVREEENELFPKVTESDLDLTALRQRLEAAKESKHAPMKSAARKSSAIRRRKTRRTSGSRTRGKRSGS